jgi:small-conductance mechanosensitive channel
MLKIERFKISMLWLFALNCKVNIFFLFVKSKNRKVKISADCCCFQLLLDTAVCCCLLLLAVLYVYVCRLSAAAAAAAVAIFF